MFKSKLWGLRCITNLDLYKGYLEGQRMSMVYKGLVFFDPATRTMLVAPIPLNFVYSWVRNFWIKMKRGRKLQELLWSYNLGYDDGVAYKRRVDLLTQLKKWV